MQNTRFFQLALAVFAAFLPGTRVAAQSSAPIDSAKRAQAIQRAMEQMRPGTEHNILRTLVGSWDQVARYANSRSTFIEMRGRASVREILDGRFIVVEGSHASPQMKTDAVTVYGYDKRFGRYTYVGFDSFGTYYVTAAGSIDADSVTVRMPGEDRQPSGAVKKYEMELHVPSRDVFMTRIYFFADDGTKHLALETTHRRRGEGT